jgi:protein-disulfide isomerase
MIRWKTAANILPNVVLVVLTTGAAAILSAYVLRVMYPVIRPGAPTAAIQREPGWRRFAQAGQRIGPMAAEVTITEFSDFQCPYCRQLALSLKQVRDLHPGKVSIVFHHYPVVAIHPQALKATAVAECAGLQGRFETFEALLFAHQPDIGVVPWPKLARGAGVEDTALFSRCLGNTATENRVRSDIELGNELGVRGTPTILINDILVAGALPHEALDSLVRMELERHSPLHR